MVSPASSLAKDVEVCASNGLLLRKKKKHINRIAKQACANLLSVCRLMQQEPIRGTRRHQIEQTLAINTEPYLSGPFEPRRMHQVASGLYRWLSRLSVPELYGLCAVFLFVSWLCLSLGRHAWLRARKSRHLAFWRSTNSSLLRAWRH